MTGPAPADRSAVSAPWGEDDEGCAILHVDMDAFFASVELLRRPELRGKPVIVGGQGRSVVLSATYEARRSGVHSAMPMAAARALCPRAIVVEPDPESYRRVSRRAMAILRDVTTSVEQVSVDEAFLDVTGARRRLGSPSAIARRIRALVQDELGITCSVGVATSKSVAKLASTHAKPDGLLVIPRAATVAFLRTLPVGALWGVGPRTRETLERWGMSTVAELADADPRVVQGAVGAVTGARLFDLAWGRDPRPVVPVRLDKSVGAECTFAQDLRDPAAVRAQLLGLADRCGRQLRSRELVARTVSVKVRTDDFQTLTRARTLTQPIDTAHDLFRVAAELVADVDLGGRAIRLLGVRAEGLAPRAEAPVQPTLIEASAQRMDVRHDAEAAMDRIRDRFGQRAVRLAGIGAGSTIVRDDVDLS